MENVLIISSSKNASEVLSNFMKESFRCGIRTAETSYQAKNILDSVPSIELAVINSPLTDESGTCRKAHGSLWKKRYYRYKQAIQQIVALSVDKYDRHSDKTFMEAL